MLKKIWALRSHASAILPHRRFRLHVGALHFTKVTNNATLFHSMCIKDKGNL